MNTGNCIVKVLNPFNSASPHNIRSQHLTLSHDSVIGLLLLHFHRPTYKTGLDGEYTTVCTVAQCSDTGGDALPSCYNPGQLSSQLFFRKSICTFCSPMVRSSPSRSFSVIGPLSILRCLYQKASPHSLQNTISIS